MSDWEPTPLEQQRLAKLAKLKDSGVDPYPIDSNRTHSTREALSLFLAQQEQGVENLQHVTLCGRIVSVRDMGKTVFAHIEDGEGQIQLFMRRDEVGEDAHNIFRKLTDLGDFIQVTGKPFRTRMGEVSIRVDAWRLLSKSLSPLPVVKEQEVDGELVRYSEFSDVNERYRQRYADLAVNPDVRETFRTRARLIAGLRQYFDQNGFLEVETPIMQPIYGGAAARPFTTQHNQLKQQLYLRISFELYLKRLIVGGIEKVFEIGRDFRNEGVDATHN